MEKILVVDDDSSLAQVIRIHLQDDHVIEVVHKGMDALVQLKLVAYDLVVLDWMLPDISGIEVCQRYRSAGGTARILMLSARTTGRDKVTGLDAGADDYLLKPFEGEELQARVRALLRRPGALAGRILKVQDVELDTSTYRVNRGGHEIELRPKEFAVLELLMRHPNESFTAEAIFARIWESDMIDSGINTVRTHLMTLRKKLGDTNENPLIRSLRGRGYSIVQNQ